MKDLDRKEEKDEGPEDVSGGYTPPDSAPLDPVDGDYPRNPLGPIVDPRTGRRYYEV